MKEAAMDTTPVEETGCLVWEGPTDSKGYPCTYQGGRSKQVGRWLWERLHSELPKGINVRKVCETLNCVAPYHHAIKAPRRALALTAATSKNFRTIKSWLDDGYDRDPDDYWFCWRTEHPRALRCEPVGVTAVIESARRNKLEVTPLVVLAAYAELLRGDINRRRHE